jgi:hypothetical protein
MRAFSCSSQPETEIGTKFVLEATLMGLGYAGISSLLAPPVCCEIWRTMHNVIKESEC